MKVYLTKENAGYYLYKDKPTEWDKESSEYITGGTYLFLGNNLLGFNMQMGEIKSVEMELKG